MSGAGPQTAFAQGATNYRGYLDVAGVIKANLGKMPDAQLTGGERALMNGVRQSWETFFSLNDQIVAEYQKGTPEALRRGDALVAGEAAQTYTTIQSDTNDLNKQINTRVAGINGEANAAASLSRLWQIATLTASIILIAAATHLLARSLRRGVRDDHRPECHGPRRSHS